MTEYKINAVNLKAADYLENDKILTLFSYESGLVTARAKGVKKARAKLKYACEPFCFGEYMLCGGKGGDILCGCESTELFYAIREDLQKYFAACAFAEYCLISVQPRQPEKELFKLLINCLNALCYTDTDAENVLLHFLLNGLKLSGYDIDFNCCAACGGKLENCAAINFGQGGFICGKCASVSKGAGTVYNTMKFTAKTPPDRLKTVNTAKENAAAALRHINAFIYETFGAKLKSIKEIL